MENIESYTLQISTWGQTTVIYTESNLEVFKERASEMIFKFVDSYKPIHNGYIVKNLTFEIKANETVKTG